MTLISCPECEKSVSETAVSCTNCGYTLTPEVVAAQKRRKQQTEQAMVYGGLSLLLVLVLIFSALVATALLAPTPSSTSTAASTAKGETPVPIVRHKPSAAPAPSPDREVRTAALAEASAAIDQKSLPQSKRRQIYFELIAAQDETTSEAEAYALIATKHDLPQRTLQEIIDEGEINDWPMP